MVEEVGLNQRAGIEVRFQSGMHNTLGLRNPPRHYKNKSFIDNLQNKTTKIATRIPFAEFPVWTWNYLHDFEDWVRSRSDLFPNRFVYYYLFGFRNRQKRGGRKHGRGNWFPYVSICKFYMDESRKVILEQDRGVIKGNRKKKRGRYLIMDWFPKDKRI